MKTAWKRILGTALVALFVVTGTATLASAAPGGRLQGPAIRVEGPMPRMVLAYVSGKTGIEMSRLLEEFKSGMTLEEICAAHGVDWSEVQCLGEPEIAHRVENLEARIARLIENQAKVEEHLANAQAAVTRLDEKIPTIEDPAMKEFAERQLAILESRVEHITERLGLMAEQLVLLQDMLEYSQSL